ncbi:MAG: hypothetical protein HN352_07880 [Bacteroidetes bacterium]|nr:hypothetical protein [Bacteroidota bacterium]MBT3750433.1 hypothetical protein [Bacteroidota bacterium]MBT4398816.1 hypothetical protein [Bacteroidota bacterium]MBT4411986.1 hypothetical protein [Bacteroidota bacterium]MBT7094660.1 hypothetical protein [Bacteroidota bacterium]
MKKVSIIVILAISFSWFSIWAQDTTIKGSHAISGQWIGLAFHPKAGTYPQHYHLKLDKKAYFVFEMGGAFQYNYYLTNRLSVRSAIALYLDCAVVPAGFVQLGLRYTLLNRGPHSLAIGVGPTLLFREDWHQFPEYSGDTFFEDRVFKGYQYRFYPIPDIEYLYRIKSQWEILANVIPGGLYVFTSSFGLRFSW